MEETMQQTFAVSVVFCYEERGWAAQCLEYDIAAQGRTIPEAKAALEKAFVSQLAVDIANKVPPLSLIPQAPGKYWEMFQNGERLADQRKPFYVPPAFMIRAAAEDMRVGAF